MFETSRKTRLGARQIEALILEFLRDHLAGDESLEIEPDDNLLTSGLIDSVGIVRLIAHVRERTDVTVPPQDMVPDNFRTIRTMAAYVESRLDG